MARMLRMNSMKTGKHMTLAILTMFALSAILPVAALAQDSASTTAAHFPNAGYAIPGSFFGMNIESYTAPWPTSYFANFGFDERNDLNWWNIEEAPGVYDYYWFDQWISNAQAHNAPVKYTFAGVPQFYSSVPNDTSCAIAPGACDPPRDLYEDGSGTDQLFKNFVYSLTAHNAALGNPIQFWDIWNAPNIKQQWTPTCELDHSCARKLRYPQLLRMAEDAYAIIKASDPNAIVTTPSPVGYPDGAQGWMNGWLKFGGGQYADVISFDGYVNQPGQSPMAENEYKLVQRMKTVAQKYGQGGKPLWINEGGWGNVAGLQGFSEVKKTAFLARYMLLQQSTGIAQAYWHQWANLFNAGRLRLTGDAYNSIVNWTKDATLTSACALQKNTTIWVCQYSRSNPSGYKAEAVWNSEKSSTYTVKQKFVQYCDLKGNVKRVQGKKVQIGIWPILLESENLGKSACQG